MTTVKKIARNTSLMLLAQIAGNILGFFFIILLARHLGAAGFGVLSFALALTSIFAVFADIGLQPLTVREVARDHSLAPKYLSNLSTIKLILSVVTFALIAITINIMNYPSETIFIVYIVALSVLTNSFTTMIYSIFQAQEKMEYQSMGQVLSSIILLAGALLAINAELGIISFAFIYLINSLICFIYSLLILSVVFKKIFASWLKGILEIDLLFWKAAVKEAIPFGLGIFFMLIFCWIDSIMLSALKDDVAVGWYSAPFRIVFALLFIPSSFIAAIFPAMSRFYKESPESLGLSFEKSFKYLILIGIPIGVGTTLLAKRMILQVFGAEYSNSITTLQILIWFSVLVFASMPYGNLFNCLNKQGVITKITAVCVVANITLNLLLIPRYSIIGASIATVLTQFISLALSLVFSLQTEYAIPLAKFAHILTTGFIASILMGIFIIFFHNTHLLILVPLSAVLYTVSLYFIKGINKEDIELVKSIFRTT